jgi:hypothetical protein
MFSIRRRVPREVMSVQGVMIMISMTAVACVREHYVLIIVVADPIVAAFGPWSGFSSFRKDRTEL